MDAEEEQDKCMSHCLSSGDVFLLPKMLEKGCILNERKQHRLFGL